MIGGNFAHYSQSSVVYCFVYGDDDDGGERWTVDGVWMIRTYEILLRKAY